MAGVTRYNKLTKSTRHQTAVIYDAISEGPIEGLVNGPNSIIIDGNPAASQNVSTYYQMFRSPNASYVSTTGVITDIGGGNIFENITTAQGERYASVIAGKKRATDCSTTAGSRIVTTSTAFFASTDIYDEAVPLNQFIRIEGAGVANGEYAGQIVQYINTTAVRVDSPPAKTVSSANVSIDLVDKVASYSGNTCTLETGGGINTNPTAVLLSPPAVPAGEPLKYNFNNFGWAFRPGERDQSYLSAPSGVGSASSAHSINQALDQTDLRSIGQPTNSALGIDTDISPNRDGETGLSRVASTGMNIADPGEIDFIRITLNHAAMISTKENGKTGNGFAEYRIVFSYKTDSTDDFANNEKVVFGRTTLSSSPGSYHANTRVKSGSTGIIDGKIQAPFNSIFSFDISKYQPFTDYKIEIQRVSPINQKENKWQQTNQGSVVSIENIITDKLTYPYTAYAGVVVDAEDFDDIPERAYEVRGLRVKVPTNYFPLEELHDSTGVRRTVAAYTRNVTTGVDTGSEVDWDGNFRGDQKTFDATSANYEPVYCNNPVWVFMDLVSNPRYGLGKYVDPDFDFTQIDKYTLYNLAKYCDELVPDGKGGTEPRFTCNLYIQKGQDALRLLKDLTTMMRGMLLWHNGQISLNSNREKGAIYTFGKSNVIDGTFEYSGTSKRFRTNEVKVTWNDPENRYKQAVEIVTDDNNIAETGRVVTKDIPALGCTSQGQAQRLGKWHLLTEKLEKEVVTFKTGINGGALVAGDVVLIQDADNEDVQFSGRISTAKASTTTVIETDRAISLNGTDNFDLHLIFPKGGAYLGQPTATINGSSYRVGDLLLEHANGTAISTQTSASQLKDDAGALVQVIWSEDQRIETKPISSYNSSNITVSSAFSEAPNSEVMYAITGQQADGAAVTGSAKEYIITRIKENTKDMTFEITAAEYDVDKFSQIDRGWVIPDIPSVMRPPKRTEIVPVPQNVTVAIVPDDEGGDNTDVEDATTKYKALVQWIPPKSIRTDEDGNALDDIYEHLAGFDLEHDIPQSNKVKNNIGFTREEIRSRGQNSFSIRNVPTGDEYRVRVRTVNTQGYTSEFIQAKFTFSPQDMAVPTSNVVGAGINQVIARGGTLSTGMSINASTGTVSFDSSTYTFQPPTGVDAVSITSGNTNFTEQSFSSLADGQTGYLLFDYDGNLARGTTRTDPLRPIVLGTDNVAASNTSNVPYYFSFFKRLGQSNEDLTQANGTFSLSQYSSNVTGSSTTFELDYQAGDIIIFDDAGASRFWTRVAHVESNTSMTVVSGSDRSYSSANLFRQTLRFDRQKDSIIASVTNTSGTFTLINFASGEKGADGSPGANGAPGVSAYTIIFDNESHGFEADKDGTISDFTTFSSTPTVAKGDQSYSYDASSPYGDNTFRYGTRTDVNVSSAVSASGVVSLNSNSAIGSGSTKTGSVTIPIIDNEDGSTVATKTLSFIKINEGADGSSGTRGSGIFTFEESTTTEISAAQAVNFAGTLNNASAVAVANAVIQSSDDGFLRPNDRITVTDNSADSAGTRIYNGSAVAAAGSVTAANFSALVTETFSGSVIVEGTLAADRLSANTTFTRRANIANTIQLGTTGDNGKFVTANKTTFADGDLGVYFDGAGNVNIGQDSGNKFIKFYSANGTLAIGSSVQIGATAASTIESGASAGSTAAQPGDNISGFTNDSGFQNNNDDKTAGTVGGWTIDSSAIYSGTKDTTGYTTGGITLNSGGSIHSKQFYIDTSGNAFFKGDLSAATVTIGQIASFPNTDAMNTATSSADSKAGNAYGQANAAYNNSNSAYGQANSAYNNSNAAYGQANAAYGEANSAHSTANSKVTHAAVNNSSTIVGGGVGGWTITQYHLAGGAIVGNYTTGTSTSGNGTYLTTGGLLLGSDGFISANQFYLDTNGNAGFKGTIAIGSITGAGGATSSSVNTAHNAANAAASDAANAASDASNAASDASNAHTTANSANSQANGTVASSPNQTGGAVAGWSINATAISSAKIVIDSSNQRIVISD